MLTTLLPFLLLLLLPGRALCSQEASDGELGHICLRMVLETLSLSGLVSKTRGELVSQGLSLQLARPLYKAGRILGTINSLCPKAKVRKYSSAHGKGEMHSAGGKQDWKSGKRMGRKGEGLNLRERGEMGVWREN